MGKMGKKKGKGKGQDERRVADEEAPPLLEGVKDEGGDTTSDTPQAKPGGGRKGKKAKKFDDDWDDEVAEDLEELGLDAGKKDEAPEDQPEKEPSASASAGGKKSKKKKRKKDDWEDDLEEDIEALAREIEGGGMELEPNQPQEKPKPVTETPIPQTDEETKPEASGGTEDGPNVEEKEEEEEASTGTVMTAAQKKAAKKEREKKKKKEAAMKAKQQQQKQAETEKEKGGTEIDSVAAVTDAAISEVKGQGLAAEESSEVKSEPMEGATGGDGDEGEGEGEGEGKEEGDDKKKKKKKKKKPEEEKKSKVKKPGKATLAKMKEQMEALRLEQKKREEEELARIRAEEEAERKRLEELRLEEERKEKKRAKERERKERRKAEGKPITRAEREKHARAQAQLEALKAQGITVPLRTAEHQEGAEKKKVLYVTRQKQKKPKPQTAASESDQASETTSTVSSEQQDEAASMISETSSGVAEPEPQSDSDEAVKENWDDEVKDNWDDESEGEPDTPVQSKRVKEVDVPVKLVQQETLESGSEEEEDEEESSSSESEEEEESGEEELSAYEKAALRIENRRKRNKEERSLDLLRSPVVCVLGHVDTGKTKILDKIRRTHVQDGEAGGITQQIGATFVPEDAIQEQTKMLKEFSKMEMKIPGLLIIDTPGHESFSNLRSRGSSMCDIAILVVDIMHGLEPQTLESLAILQKGKTPFVVALNKVDRLFDWRRNPNSGIRENLKKQKVNTRDEFDERLKQITTEFAEQGLNVSLFWEKVDFQEYLPMVPTSAITGDGMGDLIALVVSNSQKTLSGQLMLSQELEALVLEVKVTPGHGTTIDVILRDGILREGETMILTGTEGPFVTPIRTLLMPQPMRELRVKSPYVHHKAIIASQGVKVCAKDLEKTLAGTPIFVAKKSDEIPVLKDEAAATMKRALSAIQLQERGVFVQASTLGSLEALLGFLKQSKIPYAGVNIGPIYKKDIMKASVMLERDTQWAVILAFDVTVDRDAQQLADHLGVKIFMADIIYHLFDSFLKHRKELHEQKRKEFEHIAIFPSKLRILPNCIFNSRDPLVVGVIVEAGIIKPGTPITIPGKNFLDIGVVSSLEVNHKPVESARKGTEVCIKVESQGDAPRLYGRHFDHTDMLVSKINRESIDAVKNYFREDLQKSDWQLMIELKKLLQII